MIADLLKNPPYIYLKIPANEVERNNEQLIRENRIWYTANVFYNMLNAKAKNSIHMNELVAFAQLFIQYNGNEAVLTEHIRSKLFHSMPSEVNFRRFNDQAAILTLYIDFLSYERLPAQVSPFYRFDEEVIAMHHAIQARGVIKTAFGLTLKNIINYALLLLDVGIVTQNGITDNFPEKSLIHGLALTSMFFIFVGEIKFKFFPSDKLLLDAAKTHPEDTYGIHQYRLLLNAIAKEISGSFPPTFSRNQSGIINRKRLEAIERVVQVIPRVYLWGIIAAPVTIPATLLTPLISLDDNTRLSETIEWVLGVGIALYILVFGMMMFSDDVTDFLKKFIYCEDDVCFIDEARLTTAALGGGTSAIVSFMLFSLYQVLQPRFEAVEERIHHSYRTFRREPDSEIEMQINTSYDSPAL